MTGFGVKKFVHSDKTTIQFITPYAIMPRVTPEQSIRLCPTHLEKTMAQTVQLELPDSLIRSAEKIARATQKSVESILADSIQKTLPPLDDVSPDEADYLAELSQFDDDRLWREGEQTLPLDIQAEFEQLLHKQAASRLVNGENQRLQELMDLHGTIMVRKSHAWLLLARRGYQVPPQLSQ